MSDDDAVKEGKELFQLCLEREQDNRDAAIEDIKFVDLDDQWDEYAKTARKGRPMQTINLLKPMVQQIVNEGRQNRPQITFHPVGEGADDETAEIINGLVRNIEAISDADVAYDTALASAIKGGWGYWKVNTRYSGDDTFDQDIIIERVADPLTIYGDPYSMAADSADWNTAFETELMTKDAFERRFPGAAEIDFEATLKGADQGWSHDDRIQVAAWWSREPTLKKIVLLSDGTVVDLDVFEQNLAAYQAQEVGVVGDPRVVTTFKVSQRLMTGVEILEETPWAGKYIPIVPIYGDEVVLEGTRHFRSFIRPAKDAQRSFNYGRSAEVELNALAPKAPFLGKKGAFNHDIDKWNNINQQSYPFVEWDGPEAPQRVEFFGPPAGWISVASNAAGDIKAQMGMFDAALGQNAANEQSGKAIMGLQAQSGVANFHYTDNQNRGIRHTGRIILDLMPHVYGQPRVLRIITGEGQHQSVPINQPLPNPQGGGNLPQVSPDGKPMIKTGQDGQPILDPISGQPIQVDKVYDLTAGKYDLTVSSGPSFQSRRQESANQIIECVKADPTAAPVLLPELFKALDWPGHERIAEALEQNAQAQQQLQQAKQPNPQAEAQRAMAKVQQETQVAQAKLQGELQLKQALAAHDAQMQQQQMQADFVLGQQKNANEMQLAREKAANEIQLKREAAAADLQLQRESIMMDAQVKATEAARGLEQTAQMPDVQVGGGIG